MRHILIVEDSRFFTAMIERKIQQRLTLSTLHAETLKEAQTQIDTYRDDIILMVLDLGLPGTTREQALTFARDINVPVIVYTSTYNPKLGELLRSYNIVDYVLKDHPESLNFLSDLIHRVVSNRSERVLVVDDSSTTRNHIAKLLRHYQFQAVEASNGVEALEILEKNPDIRVVIPDYNMPEMNGFELVKRIRSKKNQQELAIIGVSSGKDPGISVQFLKSGANDFIYMPMVPEEFFCRLSQNISTLELFQTLQHAANTDPLTQLNNRRFFYRQAEEFLDANESETHLMTLIDIDHFKQVNDNYGHSTGDEVLRQVSSLLQQLVRAFGLTDNSVLARFGGEEFCLFIPKIDIAMAQANMETLRGAIENLEIEFEGQKLSVTASLGAFFSQGSDLNRMISAADKLLYQAKNSGRNCLITGSAETLESTDN